MTLPRGSIYKLCGLLLWLIGAIVASVWMAVREEWILMSLCLIVGVVAVVKIIRFHFQNIRSRTTRSWIYPTQYTVGSPQSE